MNKSRTYWFTGLSGAGKTTLCHKLVNHLRVRDRPIVMLDGDELRSAMGVMATHSPEERLQLAMRYARLCHLIAIQGVDVAIATISLFKDVHEWNRAHLPGYVEIFLDIPMDELVRRDPKKIYERAAAGELKNVAGLDFAIDRPQSPDILLSWRERWSAEDAFDELLQHLTALGVV
jgi:adenylylsulfate kinase